MNDFKYYRWEMGGWSEQQAAVMLNVSLKSIRRYEGGQAPQMAVDLIALLAGGELGRISPAWRGWTITRGRLVNAENVCFDPGEINAIPYREALIKDLQRQVRVLSAATGKVIRMEAAPLRRVK